MTTIYAPASDITINILHHTNFPECKWRIENEPPTASPKIRDHYFTMVKETNTKDYRNYKG